MLLGLEELLGGDRREREMDIDPIEEGARETVLIAVHGLRQAPTRGRSAVVVAARTRVHRSDQDKVSGKGEPEACATNRNALRFEGLAQRLEGVATKLGKLIEEEHAVVRESNLTRLRNGAPAYESSGARGVVRGAKGAGGDDR